MILIPEQEVKQILKTLKELNYDDMNIYLDNLPKQKLEDLFISMKRLKYGSHLKISKSKEDKTDFKNQILHLINIDKLQNNRGKGRKPKKS